MAGRETRPNGRMATTGPPTPPRFPKAPTVAPSRAVGDTAATKGAQLAVCCSSGLLGCCCPRTTNHPCTWLPAITTKQATIRGWAVVCVVGVLLAFFVYACGPQAVCLAKGGEPASNAFGAEWCDLDKNGRL